MFLAGTGSNMTYCCSSESNCLALSEALVSDGSSLKAYHLLKMRRLGTHTKYHDLVPGGNSSSALRRPLMLSEWGLLTVNCSHMQKKEVRSGYLAFYIINMPKTSIGG